MEYKLEEVLVGCVFVFVGESFHENIIKRVNTLGVLFFLQEN